CMTCTGMASCGYCRDTSACQTGTMTGPTAGSCTDWVWSSSSCAGPDPCTDHLTCGECSGASSCGWGEGDDRCRSGNSSGPTGSSCTQWDYVATACPGDPCTAHSATCDDCAATTGCGYCLEDTRCRSGDTNGPTVGTCNDWRYASTSCPSMDTCD